MRHTAARRSGSPALNIHGVAQSSIYHSVVAVIFLGVALTVGGRVYRWAAGDPLAVRSPVGFQMVWMLALSAAALSLGLVPLYGAFVAGIAVALANDTDGKAADSTDVAQRRSALVAQGRNALY